MAFEWNHDKIETLVNGYRIKTELWDPKNNNYHMKNRKTDAWQQLANDVGCGMSEVKTKMTSLLSSYRRERAKEKNSMITGSGRGQLYVSTWFAYKLFTFLKEKDAPKNTLDTESVSTELSEQSPEADDEEESLVPEPVHPSGSQSTATSKPASKVQKTDVVPPKSLKRKQQQGVEERRLAQAFRILDNVDTKIEDECSTFGQYIATKLRKFSDRNRNILMHKINTLIFETEMEVDFDSNQRSSPASCSSMRNPSFSHDFQNACSNIQNLNTQLEVLSPMESSLTENQPSVLDVMTTTSDTIQTYINSFK